MAGWEQLADILQEQISLYEAMLDLGERKSDVIVDGKVRELEKLVRAEESLLTKGGALEAQRGKVQEALVTDLAMEEEEFTLRSLMERAPERWGETLAELEGCLLACIERLGRQNRVNGQLLENALRVVNYQLSILQPDASGMEQRAYLDRKA